MITTRSRVLEYGPEGRVLRDTYMVSGPNGVVEGYRIWTPEREGMFGGYVGAIGLHSQAQMYEESKVTLCPHIGACYPDSSGVGYEEKIEHLFDRPADMFAELEFWYDRYLKGFAHA